MRYTLLFSIVVLALVGCKKDKFTTAPQITYKSIKPNSISSHFPFSSQTLPVITLHITDAEGDIGFVDHQDTSYIYVKNLLANTNDSFKFPDLSGVTGKNFQADVQITISSSTLLKGGPRPAPKTDTLFFEVYVKDFAKNKSNTIVTTDPVFFVF